MAPGLKDSSSFVCGRGGGVEVVARDLVGFHLFAGNTTGDRACAWPADGNSTNSLPTIQRGTIPKLCYP